MRRLRDSSDDLSTSSMKSKLSQSNLFAGVRRNEIELTMLHNRLVHTSSSIDWKTFSLNLTFDFVVFVKLFGDDWVVILLFLESLSRLHDLTKERDETFSVPGS